MAEHRVHLTEMGALLLPLPRELFGLSGDEEVELAGSRFKPKPETHVTILNGALGKALKEAGERDPTVKTRLQQAIDEMDWRCEPQGRLYLVCKDKETTSPLGAPQILHAESIVKTVRVPAIDTLYQRISEITGRTLETPPTHVTLYVSGDPLGVELPNRTAWKRFVVREVHPAELKRCRVTRPQSRDELGMWLVKNGIPVSNWGKGSAKTVADLWREVQLGETRFQSDPPLRVLDVAQIVIMKGDQILMETGQTLRNGRVRPRQLLPAEKMRGEESPTDAAIRCLREELGISSASIRILKSIYGQNQRNEPSPSYPGLSTRCVLHTVEASVNGLPDGDFQTYESSADGKNPVMIHHWRWQSVTGIDDSRAATPQPSSVIKYPLPGTDIRPASPHAGLADEMV